MSSTERAPEPTMEEILASIRRIITDDETGQATAQDAAPKVQAEDESLEGEADNQIIDDIARVLSGDGDPTASEEEEILDLTAELGGLEIVEEDSQPAVEVAEVAEAAEVSEVAEVLELEEIEFVDEAASVTPAVEQSAPEPDVTLPAAEPEIPPQTMPEAMPAAPEAPQAPPQAGPQEPAEAAGEEAASALERAIAALRAGQPPASTTPPAEPFQFQTAPQPGSMAASTSEPEGAPEAGSEPEPIPMAIPMASPDVEAETHPEPEASLELPNEPDFERQPDEAPMAPMLDETTDEDLVLAGAELTVTEVTIEEAPAEPEEKAPFWPLQATAEESAPEAEAEPEPVSTPEPEPEPVAAQVNGAEAHHDVAGKTMEDSIKDMLRPMLRQWLDENMPRLIREGFDPETLRRQQD